MSLIYKGQNLFLDNISVKRIGKNNATPFYVYSYKKIRSNFETFSNYFKRVKPLICFSVKSNSNIKILSEIKKLNCGADVVSKGEILRALNAGFKKKKIVFSGVGKTYSEIEYAINKNILLINVESKSELLTIEKIARLKKKQIDIGIRLNPNIDAKTLKQISTGRECDKFGLVEKDFIKLAKHAKKSKFVKFKCMSVHMHE